jgi:hypothetical protein
MKLLAVASATAGVLVVSAGLAVGAYLVQLDGGDRMTVDSYWTEGDRVHLINDGVDMSVPRARIRSIGQVPDREPSRPSHADPAPVSRESSGSTEELQARQNAIEHHLLRVQQERFEATERGDSPARLQRLEAEFRRTQQRRLEVMRELERESSN